VLCTIYAELGLHCAADTEAGLQRPGCMPCSGRRRRCRAPPRPVSPYRTLAPTPARPAPAGAGAGRAPPTARPPAPPGGPAAPPAHPPARAQPRLAAARPPCRQAGSVRRRSGGSRTMHRHQGRCTRRFAARPSSVRRPRPLATKGSWHPRDGSVWAPPTPRQLLPGLAHVQRAEALRAHAAPPPSRTEARGALGCGCLPGGPRLRAHDALRGGRQLIR